MNDCLKSAAFCFVGICWWLVSGVGIMNAAEQPSISPATAEVKWVKATNDSMEIGLPTLDDPIELVSVGCFGESVAQPERLYRGVSDGRVIRINRVAPSGRDRLFDRFQLVNSTGGKWGTGKYATDLEEISAEGKSARWPREIKGVQCVVDLDDVVELGAAHITENILLTSLLHDEGRRTEVSDDLTIVVDGKRYEFNAGVVQRLDQRIGGATQRGLNVIAILLCAKPKQDDRPDSLIHPDVDLQNSPNFVVALNTTSEEAERRYRAVIRFLGRRYSRPDGRHGRLGGYVVGNEVQSHWQWNNMGQQPAEYVIQQYAKQLRVTYFALRKEVDEPRVFASFDHHWADRFRADPMKAIPGRDFLDGLARELRATGDFPWHVAWHPYPENLFDPEFWDDRDATFAFDSPKITFKNIELLTTYLQREPLLYRGKPRRVILSEQGFHAGRGSDGETRQAAAFAASYVRVRAVDGIDAYVLHRHMDHPHEGGLRLGIRRLGEERLGAPRQLYSVFQAAGTASRDEAFEFALPIVGIKSWSEMLPRRGPFPENGTTE